MARTKKPVVRPFLRDLWRLTRPYWFCDDRTVIRGWVSFTLPERWVGRLLLACVIVLQLGQVYLSVLFNYWNNAFYTALQERNEPEFWIQIIRFCYLAAIFIAVFMIRYATNQVLQIRWRRWLTERYLGDWLARRAYFRMQLADRGTDNPDQRIAEDIRAFVAGTVTLTLGLLDSVVTLVTFFFILWSLSGPLEIPIGDWSVSIPGYLIWVALAYAIVGSVATHLIGRPLVKLNFQQERLEADFRFALVRFRENMEGVALYSGERDELRNFADRFAGIVANYLAIVFRMLRLYFIINFYNQATVIFPYMVAAPLYFANPAMALGQVTQTAGAFGQVQGALSWFVDAYTTLASWTATVNRLTGFRHALDWAHVEAAAGAGVPPVSEPRTDVALRDVELDLPNGRALVAPVDAQVRPGEAVVLTGPSGSGKSTMFRAMAGIWPFGHGAVHVPVDARLLFLPQKPYLPIGTLRQVVSYPAPPQGFPDAEIAAALEACRLPQFVSRLDEDRHWALELSPGEQQRIAFARALLHKPDFLFLDEATSALDDATETALYHLLRERLPNTAIISISHRPTLDAFHDRRWAIEPDTAGVGHLREAPLRQPGTGN